MLLPPPLRDHIPQRPRADLHGAAVSRVRRAVRRSRATATAGRRSDRLSPCGRPPILAAVLMALGIHRALRGRHIDRRAVARSFTHYSPRIEAASRNFLLVVS